MTTRALSSFLAFTLFLGVPAIAMQLAACSGGTSTVGTGPASSATSPTEEEPTSGSGSTPPASTPKDGGPTEEPAPSSPVVVKNLSVAEDANGYALTFVLANQSDADIERVQTIAMNVGGKQLTFPIATTCQNPAMIVAPGETSRVITVNLGWATFNAWIDYEGTCGTRAYGDGIPGAGKKLTLEIKGLLDDATPWLAKGEADL